MTRKKVLIGILILVVAGGLVWANFAFKKQEGPTVTVEAIKARKLESIVSASGKSGPAGRSTSPPKSPARS